MDPKMLYGAALTAVPIFLSLSVHEFAHARSALALGDPTAKNLGRCTLNPLAHLDIIGTIMFFVVGFGWAKPVPVSYGRLRRGSLGRFIVSAAGPGSNIAIALLCAITIRLLVAAGVKIDPAGGLTSLALLVFLLGYSMLINLTLCFFNLIPLFPLDGHHMVREMLPGNQAKYDFMQWQRRFGGIIILAALVIPRLIPSISFNPLQWWMGKTVFPMLGILLGDESIGLLLDALNCFKGLTPFS